MRWNITQLVRQLVGDVSSLPSFHLVFVWTLLWSTGSSRILFFLEICSDHSAIQFPFICFLRSSLSLQSSQKQETDSYSLIVFCLETNKFCFICGLKCVRTGSTHRLVCNVELHSHFILVLLNLLPLNLKLFFQIPAVIYECQRCCVLCPVDTKLMNGEQNHNARSTDMRRDLWCTFKDWRCRITYCMDTREILEWLRYIYLKKE